MLYFIATKLLQLHKLQRVHILKGCRPLDETHNILFLITPYFGRGD